MTERPRPATGRVVDLLALADRTIGACLARIAEAENVTREQWRTLMFLDEGAPEAAVDSPGHTMGEIAARVAVPPPTATRVVDRLVADGLAVRRSDPWDRRRVLVHISPTGHDLVSRAAEDLDAVFGTVLSDLPATDRLDLLGLLDRLGAALGTDEAVRTP